jgi:6-phosphogluconate dehydrogenase
MLPAGEATEKALGDVASQLSAGDVIIDGGNGYWKDDLRRAAMLERHGIHYLDVGTSGGVWGLERGYCLMVGGDKAIAQRLEPIFKALSMEGGYVHAGPTGAGHFVKMVHNGIEYGLMQAYAEGFDILRNAGSEHVNEAERYDLDVAAIGEAWRHGSVISSWLLDLAAAALAKDPALSQYSGVVADSGEGRWALMAAIEERVPADVLAAALHARFEGRLWRSQRNALTSSLSWALRAAARAPSRRCSPIASAGPTSTRIGCIPSRTSRRCAAGRRSPTRIAGRGSRRSPPASMS